jgi:transcriptional regulator with XRE-family HTH domain
MRVLIMDVLARIVELRNQKNWTEYQLAEKSGMAQSTISSWYRKRMLPTVSSLEKICDAFGITLSQFFLETDNAPIVLTSKQKELLDNAIKLSPEQLDALLSFLKTL